MAAAFVQHKVESTDDFNADTSMVATYDSNPTVGNVSLAISIIANAGRTISGVTGCGTYSTLETAAGSGSVPNAYITFRAAEVTSATAAQTFTASAASGSVADIAYLLEASGIDVSNIESGTSVTGNVTSAGTTHNGGSITPDTTETVFVVVFAFNANPGTIGGDVTAGNGWTIVSTGDSTRLIAYKVVSGSAAAVSANITTTSSRTSVSVFAALRGSTGASSTTISNASPQTSPITVNGRQGAINGFTAVAIKEVLINEAGSPVSNRTGMSLLVWYAGNPAGAPDLSYSALTTDANGTASWSIAPGGLVLNQPIFYVATDGGASLSMYTCARMVPTYT